MEATWNSKVLNRFVPRDSIEQTRSVMNKNVQIQDQKMT